MLDYKIKRRLEKGEGASCNQKSTKQGSCLLLFCLVDFGLGIVRVPWVRIHGILITDIDSKIVVCKFYHKSEFYMMK